MLNITRLQAFISANGIKPVRLARDADVSRAYLVRLRFGRIEPTRPKMLAIRDACSRILGRQVHLAEVFDLGNLVTIVTQVDGDAFAAEWFRQSLENGALSEAFDLADVLTWPNDDGPGDADYHDLQEEICRRVLDAVRRQVSEAFVTAATDVLAREKSR